MLQKRYRRHMKQMRQNDTHYTKVTKKYERFTVGRDRLIIRTIPSIPMLREQFVHAAAHLAICFRYITFRNKRHL